jgi:hypothetical protein
MLVSSHKPRVEIGCRTRFFHPSFYHVRCHQVPIMDDSLGEGASCNVQRKLFPRLFCYKESSKAVG